MTILSWCRPLSGPSGFALVPSGSARGRVGRRGELIHAVSRVLVVAALLSAGGDVRGDEEGAVTRRTEALKGPDANARAEAARALGELGPTARAAAPALVEALADSDGLVRVHAAAALGRVGGPLKEALPVLLEGRNDPDDRIRDAAQAGWNDIGPGVRATVLYLPEMLRNSNPQAQRKAATTLGKHGLEVVPSLVDILALDYRPTLRSGFVMPPTPSAGGISRSTFGENATLQTNARLRAVAIEVLDQLSPDVNPTLASALHNQDPLVREGAVQAMGLRHSNTAEVLPPLVRALEDRDAWVRLRAVEALASAKTSLAAREALARALEHHKDVMVRRAAAEALAPGGLGPRSTTRAIGGIRMGSTMIMAPSPVQSAPVLPRLGSGSGSDSDAVPASILPALSAALTDPDSYVRLKAAEILVQASPPNPATLPTLLAHLTDRDDNIRMRAGQILESLGPQVKEIAPALRRLMTQRDPFVRVIAARALGRIGGDEKEEALTVLRTLLDDEDALAQLKAAESLWEFDHADEAITVLVAALGNRNGPNNLSFHAQQILERIGPANKSALPALIEALGDEAPNTQLQVLQILRRLGTTAREAAPALVRLVRSSDLNVRSQVIETLRPLGTLPKETVPAILEAIKEGDANHRNQVIPLLDQLGAESKQAIPVLAGLVKDPAPNVRMVAFQTLQRVARQVPAEAAPVLVDIMKQGDAGLRSQAVSALGQLGEGGEPAVPALVEMLKDPVMGNRLQALQTLGRIGSGSRKAAPALAEALRDENPTVRSQAIQTLQQIEPQALTELLPAIRERLKDSNALVRTSALAILTSNENQSSPATISTLIEITNDSQPQLRLQAIQALGRLGGGGGNRDREITQLLRDRLDDPDRSVRLGAAQALIGLTPAGSDAFQAALQVPIGLLESAPQDAKIQAAQMLESLGLRARGTVPELTARLKATKEHSVQFSIALALTHMGREGRKAALPALLEAVKTGSTSDRYRAISAIQQQGLAESQVMLPTLLELLRSSTGGIPGQLTEALVQLGPAADQAIPPLVEMLGSSNQALRFQASSTLSRLGPEAVKAAGPPLVELIRNGDTSVRNQLNGLIQNLPGVDLSPAVPVLIKELERSDPNTLFQTIQLLGQIGPQAKDAIPALRAAAINPQFGVQFQAIQSLLQIAGDKESSVAEMLEESLNSPQPSTRAQAALALTKMGPEKWKLVQPTLLELAHSADQFSRSQAILGLAQLRGPELDQALPVLIEALESPEPGVRNQSLMVITQLGPAAKAAVPAIATQLAATSDLATIPNLVQALGALGPDAVPALTAALKTVRPVARGEVINRLGHLGPAAGAAAPAILEILQAGHFNASLKPRAAAALTAIGLATVPPLIKSLGDQEAALRQTAAQVLGGFGPEAKEAIPALRELLADKEAAVRIAAADALRQIGGESESSAIVPILAAGLKDDDAQVRRTAVAALAAIASLPPDLASDLSATLKSGDGLTRLHAATALARLPGRIDEAMAGLADALDTAAVRIAALKALEQLGPTVKEGAVPHLIEQLNDTNNGPTAGLLASTLARIAGAEAVAPLRAAIAQVDPRTRPPIVAALALAGPAGVEALVQLSGDGEANVRRQAVQTLGTISQAENAEARNTALRKALGDQDPAVRLEAAVSLATLGAGVDSAVAAPVLEAAKNRTDPGHARGVAALGRLGPAAAPAIPALILTLREEGTARLPAIEALGRIGPPAREALPKLEALLRHSDLQTRAWAAIALWEVGGDDKAEASVTVLVEALRSPMGRRLLAADTLPSSSSASTTRSFPSNIIIIDGQLITPLQTSRIWTHDIPDGFAFLRMVVESLGRMGGKAKTAIPALRDATKEADPTLRAAAAAALKTIETAGVADEEAR